MSLTASSVHALRINTNCGPAAAAAAAVAAARWGSAAARGPSSQFRKRINHEGRHVAAVRSRPSASRARAVEVAPRGDGAGGGAGSGMHVRFRGRGRAGGWAKSGAEPPPVGPAAKVPATSYQTHSDPRLF